MTTGTVDRTATNSDGHVRLLMMRQDLEGRIEELWGLVERLKEEGKPYKSVEDRLLRLLRSYEKLCDALQRYYEG